MRDQQQPLDEPQPAAERLVQARGDGHRIVHVGLGVAGAGSAAAPGCGGPPTPSTSSAAAPSAEQRGRRRAGRARRQQPAGAGADLHVDAHARAAVGVHHDERPAAGFRAPSARSACPARRPRPSSRAGRRVGRGRACRRAACRRSRRGGPRSPRCGRRRAGRRRRALRGRWRRTPARRRRGARGRAPAEIGRPSPRGRPDVAEVEALGGQRARRGVEAMPGRVEPAVGVALGGVGPQADAAGDEQRRARPGRAARRRRPRPRARVAAPVRAARSAGKRGRGHVRPPPRAAPPNRLPSGASMPRGTMITGHCAVRSRRPLDAADEHGVQRAVAARAGDEQVELRAVLGEQVSPDRRSGACVVAVTSSGSSATIASRLSWTWRSMSSRSEATLGPPISAGVPKPLASATPMTSSSAPRARASSAAAKTAARASRSRCRRRRSGGSARRVLAVVLRDDGDRARRAVDAGARPCCRAARGRRGRCASSRRRSARRPRRPPSCAARAPARGSR